MKSLKNAGPLSTNQQSAPMFLQRRGLIRTQPLARPASSNPQRRMETCFLLECLSATLARLWDLAQNRLPLHRGQIPEDTQNSVPLERGLSVRWVQESPSLQLSTVCLVFHSSTGSPA